MRGFVTKKKKINWSKKLTQQQHISANEVSQVLTSLAGLQGEQVSVVRTYLFIIPPTSLKSSDYEGGQTVVFMSGLLSRKLAADSWEGIFILSMCFKGERDIQWVILTSESVLIYLISLKLFSSKYQRILYAKKIKDCYLIPRHMGSSLSYIGSLSPTVPCKLGVPTGDSGRDNRSHPCRIQLKGVYCSLSKPYSLSWRQRTQPGLCTARKNGAGNSQGVPIVAQRKWIWLVTKRTQIRSLPSLSRLRILCCHELWCSLQNRLRSGVAVAVVQAGGYSSNLTRSLGTTTCWGCSLKRQKDRN